MTRASQPQTIAEDLCLRIQNLIGRSARYLARDSFEARMLLRDCERLQQADKFDGTIALIYMAEAFGDADEARRYASQARTMRPGAWDEVEFQLAQSLVGLGFFSEAQAIYRKVGDPELGQLSIRFDLGMVLGAAEQLRVFLERARGMNIALDEKTVSAAMGASSVYERTATTDAQAGDLLDLAGEVMRAHKLFPRQGNPKISAIDHRELTTLFVELAVSAPATEVGAMNLELADLVAQRLDVVPAGLAVVFTGATA
ncbi:hypothetical protein [Achromobacter sp.]|uniref:hypothetical protein n=1 Tax=Achromobacter sp. TaxID=134375 RepID=UPI000EE0907D|nr:hypothetical protein [Achromobacter sp.]HCW16873.1 hypothetical protein [Achromobacter sp.]